MAAPTLSVGALQSYPPCMPDLALSASMLPEFSLRQTRLEGVSEGPISFIQGAEAQRAGFTCASSTLRWPWVSWSLCDLPL